MPDLRVLFILDSVFPVTKGGSEMRVDKIARYCEKRGCMVQVLCGKWWNGPSQWGFRTGIPVVGSLKSGKLGFIEAASFTGSLALEFMRIKSEFDIVEFSHTPVLHLGLVEAARMSRVGRAASILCHVNEVWSARYWVRYAGLLGGMLGFGLENYAFDRFDHLITISEFNKGRLVTRGIDSERVSVIRPGVEFASVSQAPRGQESYDVVFVGRLVGSKGVKILIDFIPPLEKELGRKVKVAIAGVGPEKEVMLRRTKELGVSGRVAFLGRIETQAELYSLLKSSSLFVYPAAPEGGWSLAIIEANAAGVPAVSARTSDIGTSEEVIKEGVNGVIVPSFKTELFAKAVGGLLSDEPKLSRLSASSIESARTLDWQYIGLSTLNLYHRLADERTGKRKGHTSVADSTDRLRIYGQRGPLG